MHGVTEIDIQSLLDWTFSVLIGASDGKPRLH